MAHGQHMLHTRLPTYAPLAFKHSSYYGIKASVPK